MERATGGRRGVADARSSSAEPWFEVPEVKKNENMEKKMQ